MKMRNIPKRESERLLSNIPIIFPCWNTFYSGRVMNLSGNGMYINANICFPVKLRLEVLLKMNDDILKVPVEIVRIVRSGNSCEGMGVKLISIKEKYFELLIKQSFGSLS